MSVLILKNISSEGPGTIEDFLRESRIPCRIADLSSEVIPPAEEYDSMVILGGPMSVNEEGIYPYIGDEIRLVRSFLEQGKGVLGICLGAQIMAKALGAKVYRGPEQEIGWHDIEIVENGSGDPLIARLAVRPGAGDISRRFKVFHWHGETFDIPSGGVRLAQSALYPNQAFAWGRRAYAFQFHIEVTPDIIYGWLGNEPVDMEMVRKDTEAFYRECRERAWQFYEAFFGKK